MSLPENEDPSKSLGKVQPDFRATPPPSGVAPPGKPSKVLYSLCRIGRNVWSFLDMLCFAISPLAVIWFLIFAIVTLDELGQYVQFKRSIERDGVVTRGTWSGVESDDVYAIVSFTRRENGYESVAIPLEYYSPDTLLHFVEGQVVEVRYTFPPAHEMKGVLLNAYDEFDRYTGFITDKLWALGLGWLVLIIHPEWLLWGLVETPWGKRKNTSKGVERL